MTENQIQAIKCAYADLQGSVEAKETGNLCAHDWRAHKESINEMEEAFEFLLEEDE